MFRSGGGLLPESEPHGFGLYSDGGAWRFKAELLKIGMNSAEDGEPVERGRTAGVVPRGTGCRTAIVGAKDFLREKCIGRGCIFGTCPARGARRAAAKAVCGLSGTQFDGARKNVLALARGAGVADQSGIKRDLVCL